MGGYADAVYQNGFEKGRILSLNNLMETTGMSLEKAMEALKIPLAEKAHYEKLLEQLQSS